MGFIHAPPGWLPFSACMLQRRPASRPTDSCGSEFLLEILGLKTFGGLFLHILGALHEAMRISNGTPLSQMPSNRAPTLHAIGAMNNEVSVEVELGNLWSSGNFNSGKGGAVLTLIPVEVEVEV
ncbi:Uncharacterized protein Adt_28400 [Abeliophyllum distichum]|uniref:Uncharacterized protein n=1 Tax=Abeliophyllum distichum TaxID=126358 RepID=A0ABD1RYN2_9LAMI